MKRVQILEEKRENIYDKINEIETRLDNISARRKREQKSILEKYIDETQLGRLQLVLP